MNKNKIIAILKLVLLSFIFIVGLTYLTVDAPKKIEKESNITLADLPKTVELIGFENRQFNTKTVIKPNSVIFVGNHQSIVLANEFKKMLNLPLGQFITVSNISDAPWFIKRWQAHNQNIKLKGEQSDPWIYDRDGSMRYFLKIKDQDVLKYFVYFVNSDKSVQKLYTGKVEFGALDGAMSQDDIEKNLSNAVKKVKSKLNHQL